MNIFDGPKNVDEGLRSPQDEVTFYVLGESMRLLLVTDHEEFTEQVQKVSGQEHHLGIFLTPDALALSKQNLEFDCAVCDERFYQRLRAQMQIPIFILSTTKLAPTWIQTLQQGADGVVYEDQPAEAVVAILAAFLRRWGQRNATRRFLPRFGMLIDLDRYRVELSGNVLDLTLTELKVLKELATEDDRVIPRMAIQQQVFGQLAPGNRSLDVHVCSLRKKLRPHGVDVESIRGVGYRLLPYGSGRHLRTANMESN